MFAEQSHFLFASIYFHFVLNPHCFSFYFQLFFCSTFYTFIFCSSVVQTPFAYFVPVSVALMHFHFMTYEIFIILEIYSFFFILFLSLDFLFYLIEKKKQKKMKTIQNTTKTCRTKIIMKFYGNKSKTSLLLCHFPFHSYSFLLETLRPIVFSVF